MRYRLRGPGAAPHPTPSPPHRHFTLYATLTSLLHIYAVATLACFDVAVVVDIVVFSRYREAMAEQRV